jgi:hypothetical protein
MLFFFRSVRGSVCRSAMQVQKSSTQQPKGRGGGNGAPRAAGPSQQQPDQQSITNFFTNADGRSSKKPRTS